MFPQSRGGRNFRTRRQGVQVPGGSPSLPPVFLSNCPELEKAGSPAHWAGPTAHPCSVLSPQGWPWTGRDTPTSALFLPWLWPRGPRLCSWGAKAPSPGSFLLWFHPEIVVLDGFIPPPKLQAPTGGLKALTGVLGRPPGQPPSLVLWAGPPLGTFPPASAQARESGQGRKCAVHGKRLSGLSQLCRRS